MHIFVTKHMKQTKLCMLNHFEYVDEINATSKNIVVVLLPRIFVATHFQKTPRAEKRHDRMSAQHDLIFSEVEHVIFDKLG